MEVGDSDQNSMINFLMISLQNWIFWSIINNQSNLQKSIIFRLVQKYSKIRRKMKNIWLERKFCEEFCNEIKKNMDHRLIKNKLFQKNSWSFQNCCGWSINQNNRPQNCVRWRSPWSYGFFPSWIRHHWAKTSYFTSLLNTYIVMSLWIYILYEE